MLCKYYLEVGKKAFYENNKNMLPFSMFVSGNYTRQLIME
jgi:hypothetical protein